MHEQPENRRVVICDDEPHITRAVALKLKRAGYAPETHPDGRAAWDAVRRESPALVVTDCQMPRMSGLDLLRALRGEADTADTPVILLTGKGYELDEAELRAELGEVRLFAKPFSPRELLATVTALLGTAAAAAGGGTAVETATAG